MNKDESRSGQSNDSLFLSSFLLSAEVNQATTLPPIGDATAAAAQCRSFSPAVFLHSIFFARAKRKLREKPSSPPSVGLSLPPPPTSDFRLRRASGGTTSRCGRDPPTAGNPHSRPEDGIQNCSICVKENQRMNLFDTKLHCRLNKSMNRQKKMVREEAGREGR